MMYNIRKKQYNKDEVRYDNFAIIGQLTVHAVCAHNVHRLFCQSTLAQLAIG